MTQPPIPAGDGDVPDKVLQELLAAFASDEERRARGRPLLTTDPPADTNEQREADKASAAAIDELLASDDIEQRDIEQHRPIESAAQPAAPPARPPVGQQKPAKKVIRIGASDLPDAVYLNEEGEDRLRGTSVRSTEASSPEGRITILIGGDEVEGQSGGIPLATGPATMDPRVRARRIAVRRAVGRRRLRWVVIGAAIVVVLVAALALLGSSLFAIRTVSISGVRRTNPALLENVVADLRGTPELLVRTNDVQRRLEQDPWVRKARVSTSFPHSASIEIVERVPLATYAGLDGRFRIVDMDGKVVAIELNRPIEFMLISGGGAEVEPGASAGQGVAYAAQLVEALSPAMRSRTGAVVVSDKDELTLVFHSGARVVLGGPTDLLEKLIRLEAVLAQPDADLFTVINVSTAEISTK